MIVEELMTKSIHTISSGHSVSDAAQLMCDLKIGSLAVQDDSALLGILTSRDVRATHPNRIVADAMTAEVIIVPEGTFVWDALKLMKEKEIERLFVGYPNHIAGLVTREQIKCSMSQLTDPLTGLFRPAYIEAMVEDHLKRNVSFHLLFIDINNFGDINKKFGHPVGDDIIKAFSAKLMENTTEFDHICRYAGDEFVVLTEMNPEQTTKLIAELSSVYFEDILVSSAIGLVNVSTDSQIVRRTYRDIIEEASLKSTKLKKVTSVS